MKWGRKNSPSSSLSKATGGISSISQVFSNSWISKIKQMSGNSKSPPAKTKRKTEVNLSPLYDGEVIDDEAYWRISFGKESVEGKKSNNKSVLGSVLFDSDGDDERQLPLSNYRSRRSTTNQSFTNMVTGIRKMKELNEKDREEIVLETPRRKIQKGRKVSIRKSRRTDRRNLEDVCSDSGRDSIKVNERRSKAEHVDRDFLNLEPIKTIRTMKNNNEDCNFTPSNSRKSHYISSSNSMELRGRSIDEGIQHFIASNLNKPNRISEEIDDLDRKTEIKTEKQRRSIDQNRDELQRRTKQRSKLRVYSPRTPSKVEIIKIRALEEMKKSKLKKKKKEEEEMEGRRRTDLESCAMVKCSYDPQNDFRDSMVEMIQEKKIRRPEELEQLLACYLTLNSDEYHDLIIKVFKQVWFDLDRFTFSPELENQDHSYSDY